MASIRFLAHPGGEPDGTKTLRGVSSAAGGQYESPNESVVTVDQRCHGNQPIPMLRSAVIDERYLPLGPLPAVKFLRRLSKHDSEYGCHPSTG